MSAAPLSKLRNLFVDSNEIDALESLLKQKPSPVVFDVVEPHGSMHIPQLILKAEIWKILADAGFTVVLYIADWISFLHSLTCFSSVSPSTSSPVERCGNLLQPVQTLGDFYLEAWKVLGVPFGEKVQVVKMKEAVGSNPDYTVQMIDFSQVFTAVALKTFEKLSLFLFMLSIQ